MMQSLPILTRTARFLHDPLFHGRDSLPRKFRSRIHTSYPRLSSTIQEFLEDRRCVAIMEGQPWVSSSKGGHGVSKAPPSTRNKRDVHARVKKEVFGKTANNNFGHATQHDGILQFPLSPEKNYFLRVKGLTTKRIGGAGIGLLLEHPDRNQPVWSARLYVSGDRSPIEAEYSAIILGMDYVTSVLKARRLTLLSCNEIIVNQLQGTFNSTNSSMEILLKAIESIQQQLIYFAVEETRPIDNSEATTQAMKALATRKSLNIFDEYWKIERKDPILKLHRNPLKMGRWKEPDNPAQSTTIDPSRIYRLQFDGGAARELVGAGMVLYDNNGIEIWCGWHFHPGAATNNVAEYMGLICGLRCARSLGIKKLLVEGDSLLVVQQMTSDYQTRERAIDMFREEARALMKHFSDFEIRYIPRAENKRADWLANHAMSLQESDGFTRIIE